MHRSLHHGNHAWFDRTALASLAPAGDRYRLNQEYSNPFDGWWSRLPASPLQLWPFIALLFTERGIALPAFTQPIDHLDRARETPRRHPARGRTAPVARPLRPARHPCGHAHRAGQCGGDPPSPGDEETHLEISSGGAAGPYAPLSANDLRALLQDEIHCAEVMDEAQQRPAHLPPGQLPPAQPHHAHADRSRGSHPPRPPAHPSPGPHPRRRPLGRTHYQRTVALTWRIEDHATDPQRVIVRLAFPTARRRPRPCITCRASPRTISTAPNSTADCLRSPRRRRKTRPILPSRFRGTRWTCPRRPLRRPHRPETAGRIDRALPRRTAARPPAPHHRSAPAQERRRDPAGRAPRPRSRRCPPRPRPTEGWNTEARGLDRPADAAFLLHDYAPLNPAYEHLQRLPGLTWDPWHPDGGRYAGEITGLSFSDHFSTWLAAMPAGIIVELGPELAAFAQAPTRAHFALDIAESSGVDWFDVNVKLHVEDTTLTAAEIKLLRSANGRFIRLKGKGLAAAGAHGFRRGPGPLRTSRASIPPPPSPAASNRASTPFSSPTKRSAIPCRKNAGGKFRERAAALAPSRRRRCPPDCGPTLRPYQLEGFHFLAQLSENHFGGVLADDMGLGKTLQTLAGCSGSPDAREGEKKSSRPPAPRACRLPKSVVVNWQLETERFAPALTTGRFAPRAAQPVPPGFILSLSITRSSGSTPRRWPARPGTPSCSTRGRTSKIRQRHRPGRARPSAPRTGVVLTGTPIENRLLDLWSLFAFAQPGLLGGQNSFKRLYDDREEPAAAHARLATRVRHFLLRRTKGEVARDLPPRTEEDLVVELEGPQRTLYEAELKRTRQMLLGVKSAREFDTSASTSSNPAPPPADLLRSPARRSRTRGGKETPAENPGDRGRRRRSRGQDGSERQARGPARHAGAAARGRPPGVGFLPVRHDARTHPRGAGRPRHPAPAAHGPDGKRQELVNEFQSAAGPPVFLLSLKAAGSGLNLTAASYVVLYDPWWNPAVEAQAIDRTHRIGQTSHVIAYRLLARGTVEEKIRALQKGESRPRRLVVQEESLAKVLDLESLRRILA
ncbi:MAG: DEAD/DEAH box helicase [Lacunisphaera sp.]